MKKIFLFFLAILMLVSCGDSKDENTLYVYSWADYIPQFVYEDFENETGIKVIEDIYSSNEEMYTKIKAGGEGYDIIMPSSDYYEIMMKENMLAKLDKSQLENIENIDDTYMAQLRKFDPENDYGVPYMRGITCIAVNTKFVKDYPKDYTIYDREDLAGRMTLLDWKKNIAKFDSESYGKGFANGDFWVVQGYPDNIYRELSEEDRKNVDFIIPPGDQGYSSIDSFVVLKDSKNFENAMKFINYIHRPDVYAKISDFIEIPSINKGADGLVTKKPLYDVEKTKDAQLLIDIGDKLNIQNKYWQEILIAN